MAAAPAVRFPVFGLVRLLGLAAAAAILFWAVHFRGGMALSTEEESKLPLFNVRGTKTKTSLASFRFFCRYLVCNSGSSVDLGVYCVGAFDRLFKSWTERFPYGRILGLVVLLSGQWVVMANFIQFWEETFGSVVW